MYASFLLKHNQGKLGLTVYKLVKKNVTKQPSPPTKVSIMDTWFIFIFLFIFWLSCLKKAETMVVLVVDLYANWLKHPS